MRLLFIPPLLLLSATYFSCYVNTWTGTSYLHVHVYDDSGNISGAQTEVWSTVKGQDVLVASRKTDSDGLTMFELPAGTNEVRVHSGALTNNYASEIVTLQSGETKRLEFCASCEEQR